jgi:hypothetical protein
MQYEQLRILAGCIRLAEGELTGEVVESVL